MRSIFFITFIIVILSGCGKSSEEEIDVLKKSKELQLFYNALHDCRAMPPSAALSCAKDIYNIDTLTGINHEIWNKYGLAVAYRNSNEEQKALELISEVLPETERMELLFERAEFFYLRSVIYNSSRKLLFAAENKYQAANIFTQLGLKSKASQCYEDLANIHYGTANYLLTVENSKISMELIDEMKLRAKEDSIRLMRVNNTLALGYIQLNQLDSAMKYFEASRNLAEEVKNEFWAGLMIGNEAIIYQKRGLYDKAIANLEHDLKLSFHYKDLGSAASSLMRIGEIYLSKDDMSQSRIFCDSAFQNIREIKDSRRLSAYYSLMSKWYEKNGQYDSSLFFYRKHITFRDSSQSVELNVQLQQVQNEKQFEQQLIDYNLLKAENELRKNELLISSISIITFLTIMILLIVLLYTIRRNNRKLKELNQNLESKIATRTAKLRIINKELDTYLYRVSHDVRRPILTILGLLQVSEITDGEEQKSIRQIIKRTANEMDRMLKKLQMAYNLDKEDKGDSLSINLNAYLQEKIQELSKDFPDTDIELNCEKDISVDLNLSLFNMVIFNIMENACVFSFNEGDTVKVFVEEISGETLIRVYDNGIGIEEAFLDDIFEPYMRFHSKSTGSGLGLYLAKGAMRKLGGRIQVKSVVGVQSEFSVYIPSRSQWLK